MNTSRRARIYSFAFFFTLAWNPDLHAQSTEGARDKTQLPIQSTTRALLTDGQELPIGITDSIAADWGSDVRALENAPDHSFRSIWVRVFPLLTVPLGDPYPETQDINNVTIENSGGLNVYSLDSLTLLGTANSIHLDFTKPTFRIGAMTIGLRRLWIVSDNNSPTTLTWDKGHKTPEGRNAYVGVRFRGQFVVRQTTFESDAHGKPSLTSQSLWSVINVVPVNQYLDSVVPSEIISSWHQQTMRVQAVAARTYGMFEVAIARANGRDWDVDPTTWFQSYRGAQFYSTSASQWRQVELPSTTAAVTATSGEIMTYNGEIVQAFFSANSGGKTCTASECLGVTDLPYLVESNDAPGIQKSAGGTWGALANITSKSILDKLKEIDINPPHPVLKLEALERGPSGRTWRLRVLLKGGTHIDLDNMQTRKIMRLFGPIRSFLYTLQGVQANGKQGIIGHGYGHGVGMSQWGAELFAQSGWDAKRILQYYYKNATLKKVH